MLFCFHYCKFNLTSLFLYQVNVVLTKLATAQGLESASKLYEIHIQEFLEKLKVSIKDISFSY